MSSIGFQNPLSVVPVPSRFFNSPSNDCISPVDGPYFNSNFDENGYVFDGVKVEVNTIYQFNLYIIIKLIYL